MANSQTSALEHSDVNNICSAVSWGIWSQYVVCSSPADMHTHARPSRQAASRLWKGHAVIRQSVTVPIMIACVRNLLSRMASEILFRSYVLSIHTSSLICFPYIQLNTSSIRGFPLLSNHNTRGLIFLVSLDTDTHSASTSQGTVKGFSLLPPQSIFLYTISYSPLWYEPLS